MTALTDEAPQVRAFAGRHVIRRIGEQMSKFSFSQQIVMDNDSDDGVPPTAPAQSIPTWVDGDDGDESSSVSSDSCWGEVEDLKDEENVEWGFTPSRGPETHQPVFHLMSC